MSLFQIDERKIQNGVPGLIELVTENAAFDFDDVLGKLSQNPEQPQGKRKKKGERRVGFYRDNKEDGLSKWLYLSAAYNKGWDVRFVAYLNTVSDNVRKILSGEDWKESKNDLIFVNHPSLDSLDLDSSPDFVLATRKCAEPESLSWSEIFCVGVLTYHDTFDREEDIRTLCKYAGKCFSVAHIRRFIIGLAFHRTTFFLCVFDRSGVLVSKYFDIHDDPKCFLRGVACLPLLTLTDLGLDPTIYDKDGSRYLRAAGKQYKVLEALHVSPFLLGKGTICYKVEGEDGKVYAARDCWAPDGSTMREAQFLELVKDVKHVPRIVAQEVVKVESDTHKPFLDKTSRLRETLRGYQEHIFSDNWAYTQRDHLRTIYWPCGQELYEFESLAELISATIDVFETIETLYSRDMLHSDISPGNFLLVPTEGSPFRRGYLIDFETAVKADSELFKPVPYCTIVTTAPRFLLKRRTRDVVTEAESIFLTLLNLSFNLSGPKYSIRKDPPDQSSLFQTAGPNGWQRAEKQRVLESPERFEDEVLRYIHPYFTPLEKCFEGLRGIIYDPPEPTDAELYGRLHDKDFMNERVRTENNAVVAKCKNLLRETLTELTKDKGLMLSDIKEVDGTALSKDSTAEGKNGPSDPEQSEKPRKSDEHDVTPTQDLADQPTGGTNTASPDTQNIPLAGMKRNEDLKAQKTTVKRPREEEEEPLQDATNEDRLKRIKKHKAREEEGRSI